MPLIKKIIGTALLLWAVIFTVISCSRQDKNENMVSELPQITNKAELNEALSGSERLYAVLNAPVSGSPADDPFDILTDEYVYIEYFGEIIKSSAYYPEDMGPQTVYKWEEGDLHTSVSAESFIYDNIPIDLSECIVNAPDILSSEDQVALPENSKAAVNTYSAYYFPEGMSDYPEPCEENCGLTRYRVFFLKQGAAISFLAQVENNEIRIYKADSVGEGNVVPTVVQNGDISSLIWVTQTGDVGSAILLWIFVIFIIVVMFLSSAYIDNEDTEPEPSPKKKDPNKKKKKKKHK